MVYTETEKRKFDNILKAFSGFIREQDYFDIVYSEKMGYVQLLVKLTSEPPEIIATAEELLDLLCYEVISEVLFSDRYPSHHLTAEAEAECRSRLIAIVSQLEEDRAYYSDYAAQYIRRYREEYDSN